MQHRYIRDYLLVVVLLMLIFWAHLAIAPTPAAQPSVTIDGTPIAVDVARTPAEQEKGLSGRETLPEKTGMLFIFDHPDKYSFWMPDMHFAIDIVWIGPDWHIVDISPNVTPLSYPNTFLPKAPAEYVVEVPAGSGERYGWKVGDSVDFHQD